MLRPLLSHFGRSIAPRGDRVRSRITAGVTAALMLAGTTASAGERILLMFERDGCSYCKRWNAEIGPAYPRTAEGQAAPLRRLDINDPLPGGITLTGARPVFTPSFVLTDDGTEVGRIEGYAGDEFFWVLLSQMLVKTGWDPATPAHPVSDGTGPAPSPINPNGAAP